MTLALPSFAQMMPATTRQQQEYQSIHADFDEDMRDLGFENHADALVELKPLADNGDIASQYYLGLMSHRGLGVTKDDVQPVAWLRKAVNLGYGVAISEDLIEESGDARLIAKRRKGCVWRRAFNA